jgi:hypothetical protein
LADIASANQNVKFAIKCGMGYLVVVGRNRAPTGRQVIWSLA